MTSTRIETRASLPQRPDRPADTLEAIAAAVATAVASSSSVLVGLAWAGAFTRVSVACALASALALAAWMAWRRRAVVVRAHARDAIALVLVCALAAVAFLHPARYAFDASDASVYVAISRVIAAHGTPTPPDGVAQALDADLRAQLMPRAPVEGFYARFPGGMSIDGGGRLHPGFLHLFPAWMAAADVVAGAGSGWYVNPLFGVLSVASLWLLSRRLSGSLAATLAGAILCANAAQIWYARFPSSEMITQCLVLAGAWLGVMAVDTRWRGALVGTAACLGAVALARLDALALFVPLMAAATLGAAHHERLPGRWGASAWIAASLAFAVVYALTVSGPYAWRVVEFAASYAADRPLELAGAVALFAACAAAACAWLARGRVPPLAARLGIAAVGGAIVWLLWADVRHGAFVRLVTWPGAAAGLAGIALLAPTRGSVRTGAIVLACAAGCVYLRTAFDTPAMPGMLRRYVPVLLPLTVLGLTHLASLAGPGRCRALSMGGVTVLGIWFFSASWPILIRPAIDIDDRWMRTLADRASQGLVLWDAATPSHMALAAQYGAGLDSLVVRDPQANAEALARLANSSGAARPAAVVVDDRDSRRMMAWRRALPMVELGAPSFVTLSYARPQTGTGVTWTMARIERRLAIYPVEAASGPARALPLRIDVGGDDGQYLLDGFHERERPGGRSCRWTTAHARVRIPPLGVPAGAPLGLSIDLAAARPGAMLRVMWDRREVATWAPTRGFARYVATVHAADARPVDLELSVEAFVPARDGKSRDRRALGVMVDAIALERQP